MPTKKFWDSIPSEEAVVAGPAYLVGGMKDAKRIQDAEDGDVFAVVMPKENAELDRAVAVAVGFRRTIAVGPAGRPVPLFVETPELELVEMGADDPRMPEAVIPKYSTDLNAAFAAAEKAGLFPNDGMRVLRKERGGTWSIEELYSLVPYEAYNIADESTPALAICAAILKLKEAE